MAAMFAMPVVALVGGINFVNVSFPLFLLHIAPVSVAMLTISYRLRDTLSNRPFDAKVLSWEGTLFLLARWPWSLMGTLAALKDRLTGSFVDFRITPKGRDIAAPLPFRAIAPYAVISFGSALPALVIDNVDAARGFYIFAIYTSFLYSILTLAIFTAHIRETGIFSVWQPRTIIGLAILATSLLLPPAAGTAIRATDGLEALAWGAGRVAFTQVTYGVAGAGQGRAGMRRVAFTVKWLDAASNEDSK